MQTAAVAQPELAKVQLLLLLIELLPGILQYIYISDVFIYLYLYEKTSRHPSAFMNKEGRSDHNSLHGICTGSAVRSFFYGRTCLFRFTSPFLGAVLESARTYIDPYLFIYLFKKGKQNATC